MTSHPAHYPQGLPAKPSGSLLAKEMEDLETEAKSWHGRSRKHSNNKEYPLMS